MRYCIRNLLNLDQLNYLTHRFILWNQNSPAMQNICIADMQSIESLDTEDLEAQSDEDSDAHDNTCFDNGMFLQTKLMKILHDTNVPHFLFQQIIDQK